MNSTRAWSPSRSSYWLFFSAQRKATKAKEAEPDRYRDQDAENRHFAPLSLSAFSVTTIDEPDIASAAISGVTIPAIASGIATAL